MESNPCIKCIKISNIDSKPQNRDREVDFCFIIFEEVALKIYMPIILCYYRIINKLFLNSAFNICTKEIKTSAHRRNI